MDVVQAVFLLMSTLTHVVYNTPSHVTISYFEKLGKNIYNNDFQKKNQKAVQEAIIELLPIMKESKEELTTYNQKLEAFIQKVTSSSFIITSNPLSRQMNKTSFILMGKLEPKPSMTPRTFTITLIHLKITIKKPFALMTLMNVSIFIIAETLLPQSLETSLLLLNKALLIKTATRLTEIPLLLLLL